MLRELRDTLITIAVLVITVLVALKYFKDQLSTLFPQGATSLGTDLKTIVSSPISTITAIKQAIVGADPTNGSYITIDEMRRQSAANLAAHKAIADQAVSNAGGN